MMNPPKYCFQVSLQNGDIQKIVPKEMHGNDLQDFDLFSMNHGGFFGLCEILGKELSISPYQITKISIYYPKKNLEFSLVSNNQYLLPVISSLYTKKISSVRNYTFDAVVIPSNHPTYLEMKNYLFTNLETNGSYFLTQVYCYHNHLQNLLYQYESTYKQSTLSEEDDRYLKELEHAIVVELSIYKNYRGLCIARKKYEDHFKQQIRKRNPQELAKNLTVTSYVTEHPYSMQSMNQETLENVTILFNQENEEFLEPEEYQQMLGEDFSNNQYHC